MQFADFERLVSAPRINKYVTACNHDKRKAQALYRANIRLSQELFAVMCIFEIVLRNAIDISYRNSKGNDWIYDSVQPGGIFHARGCEKTLASIQDVIQSLAGAYTPDKAVAEFTFGFWTYLFGSKQFAAAGSTLLNVFPARPFGLNHTKAFKKLSSINRIRNRIAHHEPVCFGSPLSISTVYSLVKYNEIMDVLQWMAIDTNSLLFGIDHVHKEISNINKL
jgi:hypothetical protein